MSYGPNIPDLHRRAADYVDKILRGAKPADIPVERERALPLLAPYREVVEDGALMSYGESYEDAAQGVALYLDKIARGANPAELPIMQPTRFELTVNQKVAKELGITIPVSVLVRADRVIE
jgi:putative ABC transport system substrate-binding protein